MSYEVLLYYQFFRIEDPASFAKTHKKWLKERGILGRIYVSEEGINGTIAGAPEQMKEYQEMVRAIPGCETIAFKTDQSEFIPFAKLICKSRKEIVSLHVDDVNPKDGGRYLAPREWRQVMESGDDYVMIDVRNDYESKVGHFDGAICPPVENFYDFPKWLDEVENEIPKDKKVLMYCTGGIRCEKFSVLMKKKGWDDVNQLHGGILTYAKEEGGEHFLGKCFVFDDRLTVSVNPKAEEPIGVCEISGQPSDTYVNCANMQCNKLFLCCEKALDIYEGCCSEACMKSPYRRPYNPETKLTPFRKWYNYFDEDFKKRTIDKGDLA